MEKTTAIKFFWNGLKLNGSKKLTKCYYSTESQQDDRPRVTIYADGYGAELPRDLFIVKNDTDLYTDYHDTDSATLYEDHPLYKFARYAAEKANDRGAEKHIENLRAEIARTDPERWPGYLEARKQNLADAEARHDAFQAMKDPGQPTAADLAAVEAMNSAAESAQIAAEHEEQLKERERVLNMRNEGEVFIKETAKAHPIRPGAPFVHIGFSECPAFYSFENGVDLSVAAAELIFTHYNEQEKGGARGYDKTDFTVYHLGKDQEDTYTGRYDIGTETAGLIQHIREESAHLAEWGSRFDKNPSEEDKQQAAEISAVADHLEQHTPGGRVVSVTLAPWAEKALKEKRRAEQQEAQEITEALEMLTNRQLEGIVLSIPKDDPEKADCARAFLQELYRRDEEKARDLLRRWMKGEHPESA